MQALKDCSISRKFCIIVSITISVLSIYAKNYFISYSKKSQNYQLIRRKQKQKLSAKGAIGEHLRGLSPGLEKGIDEIIEMSLEELVTYLKEDPERYKMVFDYYQHKALQVDQRLNCVIEFLIMDIRNIHLNGPLSGIPVSVKDNIQVQGYESYVGCSHFLNRKKATESSVLVKVLEELGGIPFVKTTVPQTMFTICSSNPIDGCTKNPQLVNFQAGGSSSGEGALVGAKGSILGFGSDVGGSIRIPAAFCGVVGFKPTTDRISTAGKFHNEVNIVAIRGALGPIVRDVGSCVFILRTLFNSDLMSKYDVTIPYLPFNETLFTKPKLKIGYFVDDESYHVMPAMKRAVEETVLKLKQQGHELVRWKPPLTGKDWLRMYVQAISVDKGQSLRRLLQFDEVDLAVKHGIIHCDFSWWDYLVNFIKYRIPNYLVNSDYRDFYLYSTVQNYGTDLLDLIKEIQSFRHSLTQHWMKQKLDAIICPAGGFTALPVDYKSVPFYMPLLTNVFLWNLVDFPAATVPVTKVTSEDINKMLTNPIYRKSKTLNDIAKCQINTEGLSVSVQCIALPWKEELCLNVMQSIENQRQ